MPRRSTVGSSDKGGTIVTGVVASCAFACCRAGRKPCSRPNRSLRGTAPMAGRSAGGPFCDGVLPPPPGWLTKSLRAAIETLQVMLRRSWCNQDTVVLHGLRPKGEYTWCNSGDMQVCLFRKCAAHTELDHIAHG